MQTAGGIRAQLSIRGDDPVAGDDQGNGVLAVGAGHGTLGAGATDLRGEGLVGPGLAGGDGGECGPDLALEGRPGWVRTELRALMSPSK